MTNGDFIMSVKRNLVDQGIDKYLAYCESLNAASGGRFDREVGVIRGITTAIFEAINPEVDKWNTKKLPELIKESAAIIKDVAKRIGMEYEPADVFERIYSDGKNVTLKFKARLKDVKQALCLSLDYQPYGGCCIDDGDKKKKHVHKWDWSLDLVSDKTEMISNPLKPRLRANGTVEEGSKTAVDDIVAGIEAGFRLFPVTKNEFMKEFL